MPVATVRIPDAPDDTLLVSRDQTPLASTPRETRRQRRRSGRLAAMDGLRLLAALMVMGYHYIGQGSAAWQQQTAEMFPAAHLPASYGFLGVELFFLISGFVICMSSWGRKLGDFFTSRVVRLYPAYWFAVAATSLVLLIWPLMEPTPQPVQVMVNLTMLNEGLKIEPVDPVYWTLWVELRFYLLFAVVVWMGVTYRRTVMFCAIWTVASVLATATGSKLLTVLVVPEYSPYFIAGMAMYLMYRFRPTVLLWGVLAVSYLLAQPRLVERLNITEQWVGRDLPWWPGALLITAFFAVMLALTFGWLSWIRWSWLTVAGSLTYPLYLLHETIGWTAIRLLHETVPAYLLLAGLVAGMLTAAWLVHRFVERPLARRLRLALLHGLREMRGDTLQTAKDPAGRQAA